MALAREKIEQFDLQRCKIHRDPECIALTVCFERVALHWKALQSPPDRYQLFESHLPGLGDHLPGLGDHLHGL